MSGALTDFHLLRPLWLLALPVLALLWWRIRAAARTSPPGNHAIAPHLAAAMTVSTDQNHRLRSIDGVCLLGALLALAASGPAWSRLPDPLVAETAPLIAVLKVDGSMEQQDLAPSRLARARFKLEDLIASRAGARTALIAYAGSAHRVAPLTGDINILRPLLNGLSAKVMPVKGQYATKALELAIAELANSEVPGSILFILDDLSPADVAAFNAERQPPRPPVVFLVAAPEQVALPQLGRIRDAAVVRLSADDSDLRKVERQLRSAHAAAVNSDERLAWNDRGWLVLWPAALLALLWFRRGWTMRWGVMLVSLGLAFSPDQARAEGWKDWFLTPDQQGQVYYDRKDYARAGDLFTDPYRAAHAKYRAGAYTEAAGILAQLETPEAAFAEGMARLRIREYRPAIAAFETALLRRPDYPSAIANLRVAREILAYVETSREQSDTGETGIGADDTVFDNEAARGAETLIDAPSEEAAPLTAEQWLQSIDTSMEDFLRSRFLLENAGGRQ